MLKDYDYYWAAPLFTMAELHFNANAVAQIESAWLKIFLPQRDNPYQADQPGKCFRRNLLGIERSRNMIAVCDGADMDSGTAYEVGYARALQTEGRMGDIIAIRTDFRTASDGAHGINLMISESAKYIFSSSDELFQLMIKQKVKLNKGE
jgi:nucleoside 2-deoxyribosyltransferase